MTPACPFCQSTDNVEAMPHTAAYPWLCVGCNVVGDFGPDEHQRVAAKASEKARRDADWQRAHDEAAQLRAEDAS